MAYNFYNTMADMVMKPIKSIVIAEAGVNHNGEPDLAFRLVDAAIAAGVDFVKFQTFKASRTVAASAPKAAYQQRQTGSAQSQLEMVRKLELPFEVFRDLKNYCDTKGIRFWSTAFDLRSVDALANLGLQLWKIPSGEITNIPYLRKIGAFGQEIVLSTGMATLGEVETALDILENAGTPRSSITLLHCTTDYPAPLPDVNLRAMDAMRAAFPDVAGVGYSDHTQGIAVPIAAAARGACIIEKHFTLDRGLPGPDHAASLEPDELAEMVRAIRSVELALGNGRKQPSRVEMDNRIVARKSLVAAVPIKKGESFTARNLTTKRPGSGVSALHWDEYLGKTASRDYALDDLICQGG